MSALLGFSQLLLTSTPQSTPLCAHEGQPFEVRPRVFCSCQVVCFLVVIVLNSWTVFPLWSAKGPMVTEQLLNLVTFKVAYSRLLTQRDH